MRYRVEVLPPASRAIDRLPRHVADNISRRFLLLRDDPRPPWAKRLSGVRPPLWRFRVEGWRVLYDVDDAGRLVRVRQVERRDTVYRGL